MVLRVVDFKGLDMEKSTLSNWGIWFLWLIRALCDFLKPYFLPCFDKEHLLSINKHNIFKQAKILIFELIFNPIFINRHLLSNYILAQDLGAFYRLLIQLKKIIFWKSVLIDTQRLSFEVNIGEFLTMLEVNLDRLLVFESITIFLDAFNWNATLSLFYGFELATW